MTGWRVLTWFSVCATGTVLFLKLVANAVDAAEKTTAALDRQERRAYANRLREAQAAPNKPARSETQQRVPHVGTVEVVD